MLFLSQGSAKCRLSEKNNVFFMYSTDNCMQCIEAAGGGGCSTLTDQSHVQSRGTQETLCSSHHGATCITVGSCVWECASAGSMGPCAADFISTCRKEHRQHLRLENFQHKLYSVHNEVCFKSTLFSSLPLHTHLTRRTVSDLTPAPSN